jgi:hypothetical protein
MKQSKSSSRPVAFPRKTDRFALSGRAVFRGQGSMRWLLLLAISAFAPLASAESSETEKTPEPPALRGLLLDLERIVDAEDSSGWFVDRTALANIHPVVMESVCRVDEDIREQALEHLESEQAERGDPEEVYIAHGRKFVDEVESAIETSRKLAALQEADALADDDCPFWVVPSRGFRGRQTNRDRVVLSLETGGVAQLRRSEGSFTIGGGGAGRFLVGKGFEGPITLLGGLEFGGGAMIEPHTVPTQFVVNYLPAVPLLVRFHDVAWHYDLEVAPVALFQTNDFQLSYGMRGAFAIGVSVLRTRGFIPWAGAALAYDHYFESGGRPTAQFLRGGLRVGAVYGP